MPDVSLPSTGSTGQCSPASVVLSRRYDSQKPVPPHFVSFAWRYPPCISRSLLPARDAVPEAWNFRVRASRNRFSRGRLLGLSSSLGTPIVCLRMFHDSGWTSAPDFGRASARPPLYTKQRLQHCKFRSSIAWLSDSLSTLRRTGHPATTQDSLPGAGQALLDGLAYPQDSDERFLGCQVILSSFPELS